MPIRQRFLIASSHSPRQRVFSVDVNRARFKQRIHFVVFALTGLVKAPGRAGSTEFKGASRLIVLDRPLLRRPLSVLWKRIADFIPCRILAHPNMALWPHPRIGIERPREHNDHALAVFRCAEQVATTGFAEVPKLSR